MAYGWIITKDHLAESMNDEYGNDTGVCGPRDITPEIETALKAGKGHTFYMYDDDGEKYYTGKMLATGEDVDSEEAISSPLDNFGMPNAGCTLIKYHGKPEWAIG